MSTKANSERITQVKLIRPCSHLEEKFSRVCGTYMPDGTWASCTGHSFDVCWIRADLAKKGGRVRDENGLIWTVSEVYGTRTVADLDKQYQVWREFSTKLGG